MYTNVYHVSTPPQPNPAGLVYLFQCVTRYIYLKLVGLVSTVKETMLYFFFCTFAAFSVDLAEYVWYHVVLY